MAMGGMDNFDFFMYCPDLLAGNYARDNVTAFPSILSQSVQSCAEYPSFALCLGILNTLHD